MTSNNVWTASSAAIELAKEIMPHIEVSKKEDNLEISIKGVTEDNRLITWLNTLDKGPVTKTFVFPEDAPLTLNGCAATRTPDGYNLLLCAAHLLMGDELKSSEEKGGFEGTRLYNAISESDDLLPLVLDAINLKWNDPVGMIEKVFLFSDNWDAVLSCGGSISAYFLNGIGPGQKAYSRWDYPMGDLYLIMEQVKRSIKTRIDFCPCEALVAGIIDHFGFDFTNADPKNASFDTEDELLMRDLIDLAFSLKLATDLPMQKALDILSDDLDIIRKGAASPRGAFILSFCREKGIDVVSLTEEAVTPNIYELPYTMAAFLRENDLLHITGVMAFFESSGEEYIKMLLKMFKEGDVNYTT